MRLFVTVFLTADRYRMEILLMLTSLCIINSSAAPVTLELYSLILFRYYNGFHSDLNETFLIGNVDERGQLLVGILSRVSINTYFFVRLKLLMMPLTLRLL